MNTRKTSAVQTLKIPYRNDHWVGMVFPTIFFFKKTFRETLWAIGFSIAATSVKNWTLALQWPVGEELVASCYQFSVPCS